MHTATFLVKKINVMCVIGTELLENFWRTIARTCQYTVVKYHITSLWS